MKVLLMYPDRDFDPEGPLPWNAADLIQDLELGILLDAMAGDDAFLKQASRTALLSSLDDPDLIRYRQEILQDCLAHPHVVQAIYQLPLEAIANKRQRWLGVFSRHPSGILSSSVELMRMFLELLQRLRKVADAHAGDFTSRGFQRFFAMVQHELDDAFFAEANAHLANLRFKPGVILGARLGPGAEAQGYTLRRPDPDRPFFKQLFSSKNRECSFRLPQRDNAGARILGDIKDRGVNQVANALAQSADHVNAFFDALRHELAFYVGALNLYERLRSLNQPAAFPQPLPMGQRGFSAAGLYDVSLALATEGQVVGNDIQADGKDLVIITGANQGGKSTFLRSVGQAQLMMQSGLFAPARAYRADVSSGLFTHYRREEDASMTSGKLDEELTRMSAIVGRLSPDAMVLFNESFAATNEREGAEIARQVVLSLMESGVKIFFVTHLYAFARTCQERDMANVAFLRAERLADGSRTFRIIPGDPLETSFGRDLYRQIFAVDNSGSESR